MVIVNAVTLGAVGKFQRIVEELSDGRRLLRTGGRRRIVANPVGVSRAM